MLKKVAIALGVVLLLGIGTMAWLWRQATALPDWYTQEPAAEPELSTAELVDEDSPAPPQWIAQDQQGNALDDVEPIPLVREDRQSAPGAPPKPAKATKKKAKRHVIRGFHRRGGKRKKHSSQPNAVKASRAVYDNGELELGVIVDLSNFPKDKLSERDRRRYDRAIASFPGLTKRDVWVGVEDTPITVDGFLQLGPDAQVRIGKLRYSLSGAAKRLGMKPSQLRAELNRELRRMGLVDPASSAHRR